MWILLSVLMIGVPGKSTNLVNLQGKWTIGLKMRSYLFTFSEYSILWRPFKTVMIGVEGSGYIRRNDDDFDYGWGSVSVGFYKYFRVHNSLSPFIALLPSFRYDEFKDESIRQAYSVSIDPGIEYFFSLLGKQLSLKFRTSLAKFSRSYEKRKDYYNGGYNSYINDNVYFYLPTEASISTWICFHF